jgi:hypothetical protein
MHPFERFTQNALFERFNVDNDVRQFRHWSGKGSGLGRSLTSLHRPAFSLTGEAIHELTLTRRIVFVQVRAVFVNRLP